MITIVDYGMGNLGSVQNMFKYIGVDSHITSDITEIMDSKKLLLPGVGSFDAAMTVLNDSGLKEALNQKVLVEKVPILGICLGMQLLMEGSDEGKLPGLSWIKGHAYHFPIEKGIRIPHMGWNLVKPSAQLGLTESISDESKFYFVHSFYVLVSDQRNSILKSTYGSTTFDSAVCIGNIYGTQFHPEKSHRFGMQVLKNFALV
jgi:imidazole glycerol-phosphate synthase subunit HisH